MSTYCVIFREPAVNVTLGARTVRVYLSAPSADQALFAAAQEKPACRVLGIEPSVYMHLARDGSDAA